MVDGDFYGDFGSSQHSSLGLSALDAYYRGAQPLSYLHPEVRAAVSGRLRSMVINLPRLVVDSLEDRLDVEGFRLSGVGDADAEMWAIWQANDLDEWSQQTHLEALIYGRAFVMVWAGMDGGDIPRITVESARQMTVEYDAAQRRIVSAVKLWRAGDLEHRTVYGPDWIVRQQRESKKKAWVERDEPIRNVMGVVPVVPFVNRPTLLRPLGESEMTDVIPIADAINKLSTDLMVSAEHHAMPRRWATGVDLGGSDGESERVAAKVQERWTNAQAGRVWLSDSTDTSFGQFTEASLDNYVRAIDMLTARAAALSGLPPHYFGQAGENPASADALRASESSLVKRALRKQRVFGGAWERVMRLALLVQTGSTSSEMARLETIWRSAETPTVAQKADAAVKLLQASAIDTPQAQEDLGYTPEQIGRMTERAQSTATAPERARVALAKELQADGLSENAALAAAGLMQAAALNSAERPAT